MYVTMLDVKRKIGIITVIISYSVLLVFVQTQSANSLETTKVPLRQDNETDSDTVPVTETTTPSAAVMSWPESQGTPENCTCHKIYDPICASDNRSYFNKCKMTCAENARGVKLSVVHRGNCIHY
ncbi:uncharacterized protein LOC142983271 [Anticarsia gemmatalis]|uniref:uncharacterized protein LOC142983271 n=1 Tax=Anticarsia gemmatalis TaxID=129554 RepID=UPI003F76D698